MTNDSEAMQSTKDGRDGQLILPVVDLKVQLKKKGSTLPTKLYLVTRDVRDQCLPCIGRIGLWLLYTFSVLDTVVVTGGDRQWRQWVLSYSRAVQSSGVHESLSVNSVIAVKRYLILGFK
jgi:hypothetical protein